MNPRRFEEVCKRGIVNSADDKYRYAIEFHAPNDVVFYVWFCWVKPFSKVLALNAEWTGIMSVLDKIWLLRRGEIADGHGLFSPLEATSPFWAVEEEMLTSL
jgi:hypothetical protein